MWQMELHGTERLILLRCHFAPNWFTHPTQVHPKYQKAYFVDFEKLTLKLKWKWAGPNVVKTLWTLRTRIDSCFKVWQKNNLDDISAYKEKMNQNEKINFATMWINECSLRKKRKQKRKNSLLNKGHLDDWHAEKAQKLWTLRYTPHTTLGGCPTWIASTKQKLLTI